MTNYAAIGTDGIRPVVWGVGDSPDAAEAEAREGVGGVEAPDAPLAVVEITADQRREIDAGQVSTEALGIQLTASQIRELTE